MERAATRRGSGVRYGAGGQRSARDRAGAQSATVSRVQDGDGEDIPECERTGENESSESSMVGKKGISRNTIVACRSNAPVLIGLPARHHSMLLYSRVSYRPPLLLGS